VDLQLQHSLKLGQPEDQDTVFLVRDANLLPSFSITDHTTRHDTAGHFSYLDNYRDLAPVSARLTAFRIQRPAISVEPSRNPNPNDTVCN
jgi:hypothetical protein